MTTRMAGPVSTADESLRVTALMSCPEQVLVLRVSGEVDLVSVERLRQHIRDHVPGVQRGVVLDLTDVSFLAASGIGLLVELAEQAHTHKVTLCLVAHHRAVLRPLEALGLDGLLPRATTVAQAVVQCSG